MSGLNCPPLLCMTHHDGQADHHWRIGRPFTRLREAGVDAAIHHLQEDELPADLIRSRVVVLPRVVVNGDPDGSEAIAYVNRVKAAGALAVVFEIDDDEFSPASLEHHRAIGPLTQVQVRRLTDESVSIQNMLRAVDAVTVSTEPLAASARRYTDKPVYVVHNAIDVEWFRERLGARPLWADHLTIGWAGYRRPDADLEPMAVAWGRIAARYPEVRFVVAGWQADVIYQYVEPERIFRVPWTKNLDEYPRVHQVDIGCCGLADTPFNRCKSPIKAWEYAVAGAALAASPTLYADCILNGGFQAVSTADEWEKMLAFFIDYPPSRILSAAAMSLHVGMDHSLDENLTRWAATYSEIAAGVGVTV